MGHLWEESEGLGEAECPETCLSRLLTGGDLTQYGMHAAVTRASQDSQDYDRASDMETVGGKIIELPASDWKVIATA